MAVGERGRETEVETQRQIRGRKKKRKKGNEKYNNWLRNRTEPNREEMGRAQINCKS